MLTRVASLVPAVTAGAAAVRVGTWVSPWGGEEPLSPGRAALRVPRSGDRRVKLRSADRGTSHRRHRTLPERLDTTGPRPGSPRGGRAEAVPQTESAASAPD